MDIIKGQFKVVTPMFLGEHTDGSHNAAPVCADGVRGASVKGALRAAWRALNWGRLRARYADDGAALRALHQEEASLFGQAAKMVNGKPVGGQSAFLLRVKNDDKNMSTAREFSGSSSPELQYLLGMGLYHFRNGLLRDHITAGSEFTLELALKPSMTEAQKKQLLDTLIYFGLAGNLGSRARKGFGSVSMTSLEYQGQQKPIPTNAQEYKQALLGLIGDKQTDELPPLTAFSKNTRVQLSGYHRDAMRLLRKHGMEMGVYRGYGRDNRGQHQTFGKPSEQNFKADHDWAYEVAKGERIQRLPKRAVFGLPHPYRISTGTNIAVESSTGRRASPLFAHIHQLPSGEHLLLHTVFASVFLPSEAKVDVKVRGGFSIRDVNQHIDWSVLDKFLQRFAAGELFHG